MYQSLNCANICSKYPYLHRCSYMPTDLFTVDWQSYSNPQKWQCYSNPRKRGMLLVMRKTDQMAQSVKLFTFRLATFRPPQDSPDRLIYFRLTVLLKPAEKTVLLKPTEKTWIYLSPPPPQKKSLFRVTRPYLDFLVNPIFSLNIFRKYKKNTVFIV